MIEDRKKSCTSISRCRHKVKRAVCQEWLEGVVGYGGTSRNGVRKGRVRGGTVKTPFVPSERSQPREYTQKRSTNTATEPP